MRVRRQVRTGRGYGWEAGGKGTGIVIRTGIGVKGKAGVMISSDGEDKGRKGRGKRGDRKGERWEGEKTGWIRVAGKDKG